MASCLVTGGAGFIGSHITEGLLAKGHRVAVLDDFSSGRAENIAGFRDRIKLFKGDVCDPSALAQALQGVEWVFHLAAIPSVPRSVDDPIGSNHANVDGTVAVLHAAAKAKVRRVVYSASSSAYGERPGYPRVETILPDPLSPYAVGKLAGEHYCRAFSECFGLETISLRYFNIFGPRQDPKSQYAAAIPIFITSVLEGRAPTVYGDGEQTRDFTYVENVVQANLLAAQAPEAKGQVMNIGCGEAISVNGVIASINRILGKNIRPTYAPPRAGDVKHSWADISLAANQLGYKPTVAFEEGLRRTVKFFTQR